MTNRTFSLPEEPPIETTVVDNSGDEWTRGSDGKWKFMDSMLTWSDLLNIFGPLKLKPLAVVKLTRKMLDEFSAAGDEIYRKYPGASVPDQVLIAALEAAGIEVDARALNGEAQ